MEVPLGNRDRFAHSKEWLENNPEARRHGIETDNSAAIGPSQVGDDQPLALVKEKKTPQPAEDAPLDLSVSRQPAPLKLPPAPHPASEPRSESTSEPEVLEIGEYAAPKPPENHFRCCFCGSTFPSTEVLLEHIRIHTGDEEGEDKSVKEDGENDKSDQGDAAFPVESPSNNSNHLDTSGSKDEAQHSCRVSPDTVSGSLSFNSQDKRLEDSSNHAAAASPGLCREFPASTGAGAENLSAQRQKADGITTSISQLSNGDGSQTTVQYQTTTCEADSTVDIPMSCGQVKTPEPNKSTSNTAQDSNACISSRQNIIKDCSITRYQCPICKANFTSHLEQQHHQLSCRPPSEKQIFLQSVSLSENLTCPICNIKFPTPETKNDHHCRGSDRAIQGFNYMYSIADQIASQRHIETETRNPSDNLCHNTSTSPFGSWTKAAEVTYRTTDQRKGKVCEGCNKSFEFSRNLSRHLQCNPICRAVMVAKDPSSVKKGGYRFSFLRSKSSADGVPGTSESSDPNVGTNAQNMDQEVVSAGAKRYEKSWSSQGYSCKVCGKTFKDGIKLGVHRRWDHRGVKYGKNKGKKFKLRVLRKSARNLNGQGVSCKACNKMFKLESHLELHFTLKKKCRIQHARVTSLEAESTDKDDNKTKDTPDSIQRRRPTCRVCNNQYWSSWHLKMHMSACHSGVLSTDTTARQAEGDVNVSLHSCRRFYHVENVPIVYRHLESQEGQYVCTFCRQRFSQKQIGYNHVLIHLEINPFKCLLCDYRGRQAACIMRHIKHNHQDVLQSEKGEETVERNVDSGDGFQDKQDDNVLDLSSTSVLEMEQVQTSHGILNLEKTRDDEANSEVEIPNDVDFVYNPSKKEADLCQVCPGGYKCPFCDAMYASRSRTLCHIRKHTKARPYRCCYCTFTASYSYMIYQHLRRKHFKNRPIRPPPSQGKGRPPFSVTSSPSKHNTEPEQQSTTTPGNLPKKALYYSSFFKALPIDKKFTPIRVGNTDLWKCYACMKTSPHHSVIRTHALTHTQLKPFHCLLCPHKSVRMSKLIKHLKSQHRKELQAHFGSEAQFDEIDEDEHNTVPEKDLEDLCFSNDYSTEEAASNTVLDQNTPQMDPHQQEKEQHIKHTGLDLSQGRRSSRGRQIKLQKSLQDDYIYDFTESESDTSHHRSSPLVYDFSESESQHPKSQKGLSRKGESLTGYLPSTRKVSESVVDPVRENTLALDVSNYIKVLVLPGSQEKIFVCQCCSFKSNYESVIQAHISLKHERTFSITSDIQAIGQSNFGSDCVQRGARENESQKRVLSWFPHQWKADVQTAKTQTIPASDQDFSQQNQGQQSVLKDKEIMSNSSEYLVKRKNADPSVVQDSIKMTADLAKKDDLINAANALYTYIAGPVEKTTDFDIIEPNGSYKCRYCNEDPGGKAAAIAHLRSHTGEKPYYCDLCDVNEPQRSKILTHIQEFHMKQVLDIVKKKTNLEKESMAKDAAVELEQDDVSAIEMGNTESVDVNANSTAIPKSLPIVQMLEPSQQFRMKGIRKKNLSFYKQIIFVRGPIEEKLHIEQDKMTGRSICPYCKKTFSGRNATKQHSRIHTHEKPYYCKLCYHNARNISAILKHLQAQHKDDCRTRRKSKAVASSSEAEQVKSKSATVDISNTECEFPVGSKDSEADVAELDHLEEAEIERSESPHLLQEFFSFECGEIERNLNLKTSRNGRCKCPYCKKTQTNIYNTKRHIRIHTGEKPYVCKLCDYRGTQYGSMRFHLLKRHADVVGSHDSGNVMNRDELQTVTECTEQQPVVASNRTTELDRTAWETTNDSSVLKENTTNDTEQCSNENKSQDVVTNSTASADQTEQSPSTKGNQPAFDISPSKKQWNEKWTGLYTFDIGLMEAKYQKIKRDAITGKLKCPLCKKNNFREKSKLLTHVRIHTGEKPYKCNLCMYRAAQQSSMVHHIRNYHKLTDAPLADTSKKNIKSTEMQITKKQGVELGEQRTDDKSSCISSQKPEVQLEKLPEMSQKKVQQETQGIPSPTGITGMWKYVAGDIERNLRLKRGRISRCYKCPYCKKEKYQSQIGLKSHVRTHTNEMPYHCRLCHYKSRQQSSMRYHIGKQHRDAKILPLQESAEDSRQVENTSTDPQTSNNSSQKIATNITRGTDFQPGIAEGISTEPQIAAREDTKSSLKKHCEVVVLDDGSKDFGNYTFTVGKMERRLQRRMNQLERDAITGMYLCSYCGQGFTTKYSYVVHVRLHTGEKPYYCKLCDFQAVQHGSMKWHLKSHSDKETLDGMESLNASASKCRNTAKMKYVQEQTRTEHPVAYSTRSKSRETQSVPDLRNEKQALQMSNSQSEVDQENKSQGTTTTCQMENTNTSSSVQDELGNNAQSVQADISTEDNLQQALHEDIHHPQNAVDNITSVPPTKDCVSSEITCAKSSGCEQGKSQDSIEGDLLETYLSESFQIIRDIAKSFFTFSVGMVERNLSFEKDPTSDQYICPFCKRCFPSVETTRKHVRLHTGEKPYHCSICKWREFQEAKMVQHIAGNHRKEAKKAGMLNYPKVDQKDEDASDAETSNIKQVWACISPYITYTQREDQQACYKCDLCNHTIAGYSQIVTHIVRYHKVNIKAADVDDQNTNTDVSVSKSQLDSTSDPTGESGSEIQNAQRNCDIESDPVNQAEPQNTCSEKSHSTLFSVDKKQNLVVIMQQDPISQQYVCPVCNLHSKEKSAAMSHVQIHTGITSFVCNKCGYTTIKQADMMTHITKSHPEAVLYLKPQENIVPISPADLENLNTSVVSDRQSSNDGHEENTDSHTAPSGGQGEIDDVVTKGSVLGDYEVGDAQSIQVPQELKEVSSSSSSLIMGNNSQKAEDIHEINDDRVFDGTQNQVRSLESDFSQGDMEVMQTNQTSAERPHAINKQPDSHDTETNVQRSAHDHNYARSNAVEKSTKESVNELNTDTEVSPKKKRRRSTRRSRSESLSKRIEDAVKITDVGRATCTKQKHGHSGDGKEKDNATKDQNGMDAINTEVGQMDASSLESTKSANASSTTSSELPASEFLPNKDKDTQGDKAEDTNISNYFTCNIGNTERTLGRNIQRDPVTGFYLCPYCDKSSRLLQTTKIHMRLHTGEKPYECKVCDVKTVQHCSMVNHIKSRHPEVIGITSAKESRRLRTKRPKPDASSEAQENMASIVTLQVGSRVKKLGSTSPLKTNYKKVSKKLKTAEEDETFVDLQRSQQIFDEAKLPELKGVQKGKLSQSKSSNLYQPMKRGGIGISGLKQFAQIPIQRLGVTNLSQKFMKVALEKPVSSSNQGTSSDNPNPAMPVSTESIETGALDLSRSAQDTSNIAPLTEPIAAACNLGSEADGNSVQKESQFQTANETVKHSDLKKYKRKYRRKKGKKHKKSKLANVGKEHQEKTEVEGGSKVAKDEKGKSKSAVDHLAMYYTIEIGPIEKSLVFQKDPVTHRILCPYCSMTLSHVWSTYNHVRLHTGERPFRCNLCDYKAVQLTSIKTHLRKIHHNVISAGTGATDLLPSSTSNDHSNDNSKDIPKPGTFNVYNCFSFEEPDGMKNQEFKKDPASGLIVCPHCEATVPRRMLVEHICSHTGEMPYQCKSCEHKTTKRSAIIRHVQMYHKEDAFSKFVPQPGDKSQAGSSKLDVCASEEALPYVPKDKKRELRKRQKLKVKIFYKKNNKQPSAEFVEEEENSEGEENVNVKEGTEREEVADNLEGKNLETSSKETKTNLYELKMSKFYTYSVSKREQNLIIRKLNGMHTCPFCTKIFRRVSDAKRHVRIHTGDKPYKCVLCGQKARQQSAMINHIEKKHASSICSSVKEPVKNTEDQSNDSNARDAKVGENTGEENVLVKCVDETMCGELKDIGDGAREKVEEKLHTVVEEKLHDAVGRSGIDQSNETEDSGELSITGKQTSVVSDRDTQDCHDPKETVSQRCENNNTLDACNKLGIVAEAGSEASMSKSKDNNQCSIHSERLQSGDGTEEKRKPIEDILEELLTDVDESRTEDEGFSYMSDPHTGNNALDVAVGIQKLGNEEETNKCGGKGGMNEPATGPGDGCQPKTLVVQKGADAGSKLEKLGMHTAKEGNTSTLEKEGDEIEQGKLKEVTKPEKHLTFKERDEMGCEESSEIPANADREENTEAKVDSDGKRQNLPGSVMPVQQIDKEHKLSRKDCTDSPGSASSKSDQSSPSRPGSSSKAAGPRGGSLHYSYEPWDEDTCDVTLESNSCMYQCPHCSYRHRTKAVVRTHIRTHTGFKPYLCHYCDYKSTHCTTMKKHLWKEHGLGKTDGDPTSSSSDSDSGCLRSSGESPHFLFSPSDEEKSLALKRADDTGVFICSYCDRPFSTEGNLRIHIRTHTGDKPYHCRHCDFRTAYGFLMQKHINMLHKEQQTVPKYTKPVIGTDYLFKPSEEERARVLRRCSNSDMYKCEDCGKEMVHEFDVVAHMRSHSGDTPYHCSHCDVQTMTQMQIVKHVSSVHKQSPNKV